MIHMLISSSVQYTVNFQFLFLQITFSEVLLGRMKEGKEFAIWNSIWVQLVGLP